MTDSGKDTRYKQGLFRGQTEAQWAVFFDQVGIAWVYEPEPLPLDSGSLYSPDFWLQNVSAGNSAPGVWFEVKRGFPEFTHEERDQLEAWEQKVRKPQQLANQISAAVYVAFGCPQRNRIEVFTPDVQGMQRIDLESGREEWRRCPACDMWTLQPEGANGRHCNVTFANGTDPMGSRAAKFAYETLQGQGDSRCNITLESGGGRHVA